jgi:hypothetical protein
MCIHKLPLYSAAIAVGNGSKVFYKYSKWNAYTAYAISRLLVQTASSLLFVAACTAVVTDGQCLQQDCYIPPGQGAVSVHHCVDETVIHVAVVSQAIGDSNPDRDYRVHPIHVQSCMSCSLAGPTTAKIGALLAHGPALASTNNPAVLCEKHYKSNEGPIHGGNMQCSTSAK